MCRYYTEKSFFSDALNQNVCCATVLQSVSVTMHNHSHEFGPNGGYLMHTDLDS